jgi:hypothetical protein
MNRVEGVGRAMFAAVFLMIGGVLDSIVALGVWIIHGLVLDGRTSAGAAG